MPVPTISMTITEAIEILADERRLEAMRAICGGIVITETLLC